MLAFSVEEFNTMIEELLGGDEVRFDTLAVIAQKTLLPYVRGLCSTSRALSANNAFEDVMQIIHIKLIKNTIPKFLKKDGANGEINYDPEGFQKWMYTVAKKTYIDYYNKSKREGSWPCEDDLLAIIGQRDVLDPDEQAVIDKLESAFDTVLNGKITVYKSLTWFAQGVFMIGMKCSAIEAKHLIDRHFAKRKIEDMYRFLDRCSSTVSWMAISEAQKQKLEEELDRKGKDGKRMGECIYSDLYMSKGGLATISDWIYRVNKYIQGEMKK